VVTFACRSSLLQRQDLPVPVECQAGLVPKPIRIPWIRKKNTLSLIGVKQRLFDTSACSLFTLPTEVPWIPVTLPLMTGVVVCGVPLVVLAVRYGRGETDLHDHTTVGRATSERLALHRHKSHSGRVGHVRVHTPSYLHHGAESFLRNQPVLRHSKISPHFMEPEGSLPH